MRRPFIALGIIALFVVCAFFAVQGSVSAAEEAQRTFVGATKCKTCHKTAAQGEQFVIWEKSKHAKALETLGTEKAMAVAKERGIEDPLKADECLKCHVTGHGVDAKFLGPKYSAAEGIGCESCHGAGADYIKSATMKGITKGEIKPASVGLTKPDEKTCVACHNEESPFYKEFKFEEMYAKIAHPIPEERKAKYQQAGAGE